MDRRYSQARRATAAPERRREAYTRAALARTAMRRRSARFPDRRGSLTTDQRTEAALGTGVDSFLRIAAARNEERLGRDKIFSDEGSGRFGWDQGDWDDSQERDQP